MGRLLPPAIRRAVPARSRLQGLRSTARRLLPGAVVASVAAAVLAACATGSAPPAPPPNPLRGDAAAIEIGRVAYAQHCASCHGEGSVTPAAEGPDLRRLDGFCRRLKDESLKPHCRRDVDAYYLASVLDGKVRAGIVHMPAWRGKLTSEEIWAIRSFVETRPLPQPRTLPDLPPVAP